MLIRCPKCGLLYSYVRNICHVCENCSIFFGAIFNGDRREYKWNCETNSIPEELKKISSESKAKQLDDKEFVIIHDVEHKWNCICSNNLE